MSATIVWADRARDEFYSILSYLTEHSPRAVQRLLDSIAQQTRRLAQFPESGRKVPEFPDWRPQLRELIIGDYRLVYILHDRRIKVLTLFHGRRRFKKLPR